MSYFSRHLIIHKFQRDWPWSAKLKLTEVSISIPFYLRLLVKSQAALWNVCTKKLMKYGNTRPIMFMPQSRMCPNQPGQLHSWSVSFPSGWFIVKKTKFWKLVELVLCMSYTLIIRKFLGFDVWGVESGCWFQFCWDIWWDDGTFLGSRKRVNKHSSRSSTKDSDSRKNRKTDTTPGQPPSPKKKLKSISQLAKLVQLGKIAIPKSVLHYVEDAPQLLDQVFTILTPEDVKGVLPDILKVSGLFEALACSTIYA